MGIKKIPSNIEYINVITDIFLSICKEVNIGNYIKILDYNKYY